ASLLPSMVEASLKALPVPKPMRWGDRDYAFVRPAHWLVMLLGDAVVEGSVLGLSADRFSRGHRFHHPKPVWIAHPGDYVDALRAAHVLADPDERKARIRAAVEAAGAGGGGRARIPEALLDEVSNITEWPVAIACSFGPEFLRVPQEALVTTMEANQKFFPVFDPHGRLTEHFVGVANIESRDPGEIRRGYERVIRPRFADAAFFFDEDLKSPLAEQRAALERVTYQQKLGTLWDKTVRVAELARQIANRTGSDAALATRAASLSRCDLMSRMVGEFPELQGTMGRYYATEQGEPAEVANAIDEFYAPRHAGDAIAHGGLSRVLAIADKADTLAGAFAIGQKPTGNKDPFSLRRTALGLARTLIEGGVELNLVGLLREAVDPIAPDRSEAVANELYEFVLERLRGYYADKGIAGDVFDAVAAVRPASLVDFDRRLRAIVEFAQLPAAASLAAANKRIGNLLRQAREKGIAPAARIDAAQFEPGPESALGERVAALQQAQVALLHQHRYVDAMRELASLREPVDAFFDQVMVMVEDTARRDNRLALLAALRAQFLAIADISLLQAPAA
ncbi:MAG TPA: glycine--tRNA ligase subunit beta, partial [Xanthomonadales bacterium]|nr:glycine--tRNA ligase subunit beta [Xanthomonadales bacterium]